MSATATVARQPAAASMMARVDRLDLLLGYLEDMHRAGNGNASPPSATTTASSPSTPAARAAGDGVGHRGLVSSDDDDDDSSAASSMPRGRGSKTCWRRPRPAKEVLEEAQAKGSLIERIAFLERRVLKMEEDMEITPAPADEDDKASLQPRARTMTNHHPNYPSISTEKKRQQKKGLKSLVKSCVRGNLKTKD